MPVRGGSGSAAWQSAGGYFLALTTAIAAGDAFKLVSRETDLGAGEAFILDTEVSVTQPLLKLYNNTNLRLTIEATGNLIPGAGTTWGGFDLGDQATTLGIYRGAANTLFMKADLLSFQANAAAGYCQFFADSKEYMRMTENKLSLGMESRERGWLVLMRDFFGAMRAGLIEFKDESDVSGYLWKDTLHNPRFHTSDPGEDDTVGASLRMNMFGTLYTDGGVGTQALTVGGTWYKVTQFDSLGESDEVVPSAANNKITVPVDGIYAIAYSLSFDASLAGVYGSKVRKNGAADLGGTRTLRKVLNAGDAACVASGPTHVTLADGDFVEVFVQSDQVNPNYLVLEAMFSVDLIQRT